jgi:hypothetical protein
LKILPRRRGRPPGSAVRHPDFHAEVWITIRLYRICARVRTGKTPSVRQACDELAARGGIISAVGGTVEALAAANAQRNKRWPRFEIDSTGAALTPSAMGPIFSSHSINNAGTLQARYSEANQVARSDRRVRLTWMNLCRQRLGWPTRKAWRPG